MPNNKRKVKPQVEVVKQAEKKRRENLIRQSIILGMKLKVGDSTENLCDNLRRWCYEHPDPKKNYVPICGRPASNTQPKEV